MVEIYAEMSSVWEWVHANQVAFRLFQSLPLESQLRFCKCPEFSLCRFPVAGRHIVEASQKSMVESQSGNLNQLLPRG